MAGGYVKRILKPSETLNVLKEIPIVVGEHFKGNLDEKQTVAGFKYQHVPKDDRVMYFDLREKSSPSHHLVMHLEEGEVSKSLTTGLFKKHPKDLRPCFYLPYMLNAISRMKLSAVHGEEVNFFATDTIDGCHVYVEGPADTPKVTHANAQAVAPYKPKETELEKLQRIQQKTTHMANAFANVQKGAAIGVERKDYILDTKAPLDIQKTKFAMKKGIPVDMVLTYQPIGAVVGVRGTAGWKFFLQQNGQFMYKRPNVKGTITEIAVLRATEFWPNNPGGFNAF